MTTRRILVSTAAAFASLALFAGTATAAPAPGSDGLGDPYYPQDGNGGYDVSHYDISFSYDPPSKKLEATTRITARAEQDLSAFNLDLSGLTVDGITVDGKDAKWSRSGEHELTVTPETPLSQQHPFTVEVRYGGTPKPIKDPALGENGWQYGDNGAAFAAGEPHGAATWFPVNDSPLDKATYSVSGTLPKPWTMIANGRETGTSPGPGKDKQTFKWAEPVPMASYLATVGIDKWTMEKDKLADGTPVVSSYAPGTPEATKQAEHKLPEVLDFLSSKFGKYPMDAAGGIFVGTGIGFSLETQTRPVYSKDMGDLDTIIHENAHQWWGDSVSVHHWKDVCLNECFASYAPWLWDEAKDGADLNKRYDQKLAEHNGDKAFWAQKLYDPGKGKEFTGVYDKGPLALHALRHAIGDDAFFRILEEWPAAHRDKNASWAEFEKYVQQVSGKDLRGFFDAWFHGATVPGKEYLHPGGGN
ncbi:M1 family metallopeptidase [Sciscionella sediminilitoris]|uniref:M1 family metallopeptidase n=1 Tax=Sciscionella sediminilitoris TaxID=1445613 RepID=UPI0004DFB5C4|nr:M1 family metallopeptidase [Sciscionella sp. SE31]